MKGTPEVKHITREIVDRLVAEYSPERVILFGSYAYGNPDADSDIDLLIIKNTAERFLDRVCRVRQIVVGLHPHVPFEPVVLTPEEISRRRSMGDPFIDEILQKGELLYAA